MKTERLLAPALLLFCAAALFLSLAPQVWGNDRAEDVAKMLSRIPLDAADQDELFEVQYGRPERAVPALTQASDDPQAARLFGTGRGLPPEIAELLLMQMNGAKALVGFDMTEILESAALTQDGLLITLFRFESGIRSAVEPALGALGYDRDDRGGIPVWARGEDFAFDMTHLDPANPFGGRLGRWGRVAVDRDLVAWSPAWAPIDGFAAGLAGINAHPHVATLVDVLDRPEAGQGTLIGARFILDSSIRWGSPAMMSVDMTNGTDDVALFAFVVPPDQTAETLIARAEWHWHNTPMRSYSGPETFGDRFGGNVEFSVIAGGLPVVLIRITAPRNEFAMNHSFLLANGLFTRGDLEILLAPRAP